QSILSIKLPVAEGAAFDSHAEEHNPTCLPDTRVELLQHIMSWTQDPNAKAIFWLNGMAGTGKSTVSRTIAKSLVRTGHLGASFFFKRGDAAQLAIMQTDIGPHVKDAIKSNSDIGNKGLREQFNQLILQPLSKFPPDQRKSGFIVIVIDALDECELEDDVKLIIRLFNHDKSLGLRVFLTSRPELPIRLGFSAIQGEFQDVILHEISEPVIQHDLSVLIRHELQIIRDNYNKTVQEYRQLKRDWPGQSSIDTMVKMAVPLFIFASTICRFLADRKCGSPDDQLRKVLEYETKSQESKLDATYLPVLNQQIAGLITRERNEVLQQFKYIVGSIVLLASPLSTSSLSQLLRISRDAIDTRLDMLHSVLSIPQSSESPIRLLHLSFRDFLVDSEKKGLNPFWIDKAETHAKMTDNCLHVMKGFLREDMCGLRSQGLETVCIPAAVQYACLNWVFHLQGANYHVENYAETLQFLEQHFLHWVEALSLIQQAPESVKMITSLQALSLKKSNKLLSEFLDDALRILQPSLHIIASAPLQIYSSVLLFAPSESIGHDFAVISVAFSHDSSFVASASDDHVIRLWRVDTSECVHILGMPSKERYMQGSSLAFSNDSSLLAAGFSHETITQLWETNTGTYVRTLASRETLESHSDASIAFSHDLSLVASSSNHVIQVWRADTGDCVQKFKGHCRKVFSIALSHDSSLMVSASSDKTVRLWNVETGTCIRNFEGHTESVLSVAFSHESTIIASSSGDGTIRLWQNNLDNDVQESDDYSNKALPLKRAETSDSIQGNRGYSEGVKDMVFSHDSSLVASSSYDGIVRIWHAETGDCVREFRRWYISQDSPQQQLPLEICRIIFSHNSTYVAMATSDETFLWIWNVNTGECFRKLTYRENIYTLAFSHDSSLIASASEGTIPLWRVDTGDCFLELEYEEFSQSLAFSHDSSLLASESGHAIQLWSVDTGECIRELMRGGIIRGGTWFPAVAFSHDSSLIASSSQRGIIQLWRTNTGECVHKFHTHRRDGLDYLSFTPDGLHLVTRFGALMTLRGEQIIRFDGFGFNEDYSWITWNGVNLIWIPTEYRPALDCSVVSKGTLAVGCNSGRVWFMKFSAYPH
ncbi:hypothetical protein N5P37_003807, partial [Trichoderma harzianum]